MTSLEWEAANEDDSDRFPQTSHASAPESTESHERGSRVVPDPARVARYAEALRNTDNATLEETNFGQLSATYDDAARAVVAVADEDHAALVAEVERLRADGNRLDKVRVDLVRRANAAESAAHFRKAQIIGARRRAEAAEAKVAKVEALHVRVGLPEHHRTEKALAAAPDRCSTCWIDGNYAIWPCPTIAVLADAPAGEVTPSAGEVHNRLASNCRERPGLPFGNQTCYVCAGGVTPPADAPAEQRAEGGV